MISTLKISSVRFELPEAEKDWVFSPRPGGWWIAEKDGRRQKVHLIEQSGKIGFSLNGILYWGEVIAKTAASSSTGSRSGSEADLTAQFPGKVRKILISVGALVAEGDPLVLVEAMKMEFSIKAPFSGKIKAIRVTEGQQLSPGDVLVDLEALS